MIKSDNSIKKISLIYFISLIPLILFGFYKNGISLYIKGYVNVLGMFKPLLFIIIGLICGILSNIIYEKINKSDKNISDILFSSFHMLYGVLIASVSSINTNLFLFSIVTFLVLFISKFIKNNKVNIVALASLIIFFIMNIFHEFSFLNSYEVSNHFNMNAIDYLFGKGSGGIFTTNIILLIISFIILYCSKVYKKNVSLFSIISFTILTIIYSIFKNDIGNIMNILFTNGIMFSFIFIATDTVSSSYTKNGQIIYGILVGVFTFLLYLIQPQLSSFGGIFIASILNSLIDLKFE